MINVDLLKQLIIEEKKKNKMNLVEQASAAPAAAPTATPAGGTPAPAAKPAAVPAATINMADADIAAAVSGWAQLLKNAKSPAFAKLKPFFDANKVKIT